MCGIVSAAQRSEVDSPVSPTSFRERASQPEILWRDENFTAYREKANPVSSKGHVVIAFNLHVPSLYTLSSSDLPLLASLRDIGIRVLNSLLSPSSPLLQPSPLATVPFQTPNSNFHIGFITPPFRDSKIPVTDHLHAHAYIGPGDLMGWWRGLAFSGVAWYAVEDLIAEIRESTSNNRVKSGYENRLNAPIDRVPGAGSRAGLANGMETTEPSLAAPDIEEGLASPSSSRLASLSTSTLRPSSSSAALSPTSSALSPTSASALRGPSSSIPHLSV